MKTYFTSKPSNLKRLAQFDENYNQKALGSGMIFQNTDISGYNHDNQTLEKDDATCSNAKPSSSILSNNPNLLNNSKIPSTNSLSISTSSNTSALNPTDLNCLPIKDLSTGGTCNNIKDNSLSCNRAISNNASSSSSIATTTAITTGYSINTRDSRETSPDSCDENNSKGVKDQLKDTKSKLKIITIKFNNVKKERDNLQKENKSLQDEIMTLQSSLRQMIPGFSNTGSSFPMFNELINNISEFYKYDCEDIFFDLLCPELNMKGIILFYYTCFHRMIQAVNEYFAPSEDLIKKTACVNSIDGPIMNVLRKSYQSTWKSIVKQCFNVELLNDIIHDIQSHLKLGANAVQTNQQISNFLNKMAELVVSFYISDPPVFANYKAIGSKVQYNSIKHEPMDGFIKNKEECIIILPSAHKYHIDGELVSKALVLQVNYEIPNQKGCFFFKEISRIFARCIYFHRHLNNIL